jgi:hypothetical protein
VADERGRGPGDTLYEEHEPTELVPVIPQAVPPDAQAPQHAAYDPGRPVFVSMKPQDAPADRTEVVPAIERPDMRPRLRPVSELPLRHPTPLPLGNYARPRTQGKRSLLWLYVILAMAAALLGAGITLWIRTAW